MKERRARQAEKMQRLFGSGKAKVVADNFTKEDAEHATERLEELRQSGDSPAALSIANYLASIRNIYLNNKVDDYIKWYYENMVKNGRYTDVGKYWQPIDLRNFIEKMAVWYELRYPDYEINRLMPGSAQEEIEINNIMFNDNSYINDLLDEEAEVRELDWAEFYNTRAFIRSLPWKERYMFTEQKYRKLVYIDSIRVSTHLHLTSNGLVEEAEGIDVYSNFKITDEELKGMHLKQVGELLKEKGIKLPRDNELEQAIKNVENWQKQKEGMLDCVVYRIIERGGNRFGPRRALLFAKEFGRNIGIPMMYGVDYSDPGLRRFINEYIKAGGSKDLMCYINYFSRANENEKFDTISVGELLRTTYNDCIIKYTPEETELQQRLVNTLVSQVPPKEEVRYLRLQRKIAKSRRFNSK